MRDFYQIHELAKLFGLHPDTLRYYEEKGLLHPERRENGYRVYRIRDICTLNIVRAQRELGVPVEEIGAYLERRSVSETLAFLDRQEELLERKMAELLEMRGESRERRARLLLDLETMLQAFQTGIRYAAESLAGLVLENQASRFCRLAERDSQFLSDPAGALERAGCALLQEPGDVELYLGFVRGLGVSDTQGQLEHIALYRALLEPRLEQARADAAQKSRVLVALGLFGGITLSLLLL